MPVYLGSRSGIDPFYLSDTVLLAVSVTHAPAGRIDQLRTAVDDLRLQPHPSWFTFRRRRRRNGFAPRRPLAVCPPRLDAATA